MKFNIKIRKIFAELFGLFGARPNLFFPKNFEINVLNYHFFSKDNDGSVELEDLEDEADDGEIDLEEGQQEQEQEQKQKMWQGGMRVCLCVFCLVFPFASFLAVVL